MNYIWVNLPILNATGNKMIDSYYPENPSSTVACWLAILEDLNKKFPIDNNKIILAGFSRGAVAISYIGNWNGTISGKWAGYFAYAHFDGCCQNIPGKCEERINKMQSKKILIMVGKNDRALICSKLAYQKLKKKNVKVTYIEIPDVDTPGWQNSSHNPYAVLEEAEWMEQARNWLDTVYFRQQKRDKVLTKRTSSKNLKRF
jgi:predicted peptidase